MASPTTLHLTIHGHVHGVFYRDSMQREAERLAITGWVRNCGNGTVEAIVQGETSAVETIVQWARRGPEHAQVEHVGINPGDGEYTSFEILD
jgi:acylphosphatase